MPKLYLLLLFCTCTTSLFSQSQLAIGDWEVLLPFRVGQHLTYSDDKVFYASEFALMSVDKQTYEREYITKVDGLHDVRITSLAYDESTGQLLVAYDNTKLDIIQGDNYYLITDIFEKSILGDKTIYDIYISDESQAYLSTGFGIVQLDLTTRLFGFFAKTNFAVNTFVEHEGIWYAGTEDGLYTFDKSSTANPANFLAWTLLGAEEGLEVLYNVKDIHVDKTNTLHLCTEDRVYTKQAGSMTFDQYSDFSQIGELNYLFDYNDKLHACASINQDSELFDLATISQLDQSCTDRSQGAYQDQYGTLWLADQYQDVRFLKDGNCGRLYTEGPGSSEMSDLLFEDDTLYIASGGVADNFTYTFERAGFYTYADRDWTNHNEYNTPIIADSAMINVYKVAKNPITDNLMVGTYWNGILDFDLATEQGEVYNQYTNSSLQGAVADENRTRIAGLTYDNDDNLWISNFASSRPLSVLTSEGIWHSFATGNTTFLTDIVIDNLGYKWIVVGGTNGGVLVYDDAGTIANPNDDDFFVINSSNSELETNIIHSIAIDKDGDVWVGSDMGPVIFQCGSNVFAGECQGSTRKVLQDDIPAVLLQTESIRALHIDGGNRKWFGTTNGVYVQTADANTQVHHYTSNDSPLLDNTIIDFAFDGDQGIMYIATNSGLNAVRTEATGAKFSHSGSATVFPNPVEPHYDGPIAIKGLAENANIKITDVNGLLVYEGEAIGGQAIWDGRDYNGTKASTGVYLVFSSTTDTFRDADTFVTKIMMIR